MTRHTSPRATAGADRAAWVLIALGVAAMSLSAAVVIVAGPAGTANVWAGTFTTPTELDMRWRDARDEVRRDVLPMLTRRQAELARGLRNYRVYSGDPSRREIALTFDDGPHPSYTPKILGILKKHNAHATFFVVGEMAARYPDLVRAQVAGGHSLGNHTYHHVNLTLLSVDGAITEIKACGNVLQEITGRPPRYFRPPGGQRNTQVAMAARALGYRMVLWNVFPADSRSPGRSIIRGRVLDDAGPGAIVLLHDGIRQTLDVLPGLCRELQARGYRLVSLDEMLQPASPPARPRGS